MILRKWVKPGYMWKRTWKVLVYSTTLSTLVYTEFDYLHQGWFHLPFELVPSLITALTLFLAFRNNSAYDRWWEARKVWGGIVNDTRTFYRLVGRYVPDPHGRRVMLERHICWLYALKHELREEEYSDHANREGAELNRLESSSLKLSLRVLNSQSAFVSESYDRKNVQGFEILLLEETLNRFTDHQGKCERIKNTPLPRQYDFYIRILLFIFVTVLPFSLADLFQEEQVGPMVIPVTVILSFVFFMLNSGGEILEDPFENRASDIPMSQMVRNLEIEIMTDLGYEELPEPLQPEDGVVM